MKGDLAAVCRKKLPSCHFRPQKNDLINMHLTILEDNLMFVVLNQ